LGNRVSMEDRNDNTIAYVANTVNEYTAIGGVSVAYDACGNLSKDAAGYQYFYDHACPGMSVAGDNRLTQVKDSGDNVEAEYLYVGAMFANRAEIRPWRNALGRRIRTILGGVTAKYYYDGQRVILETDNAGTTDQRMFAYGNYVDEVLVMEKLAGDNQGMYYYGHDHLFSVCVLFDDSGAITEYTQYDAYGYARTGIGWGVDETWFTSDDTVADGGGSNVGNPYFFTGRRLDLLDAGALPLMYYRARTYDPTTGRFLQRDPIGYADSLNAYEYGQSSPDKCLDPYGWVSFRIGQSGEIILFAAPTLVPGIGVTVKGKFATEVFTCCGPGARYSTPRKSNQGIRWWLWYDSVGYRTQERKQDYVTTSPV